MTTCESARFRDRKQPASTARRVVGVLPPLSTSVSLVYVQLGGQFAFHDVEIQYGCRYDTTETSSWPEQIDPGHTFLDVMAHGEGQPTQTASLLVPPTAYNATGATVSTGPTPECPQNTSPVTGQAGDGTGGNSDVPALPLSPAPDNLVGQTTFHNRDSSEDFQYTETWNLRLVDQPDTDLDGTSDYLEIVRYGTDPTDPNSHP